MKRAKKRHNKKTSDKAIKEPKSVQTTSPAPAGQQKTLAIQQSLNLAVQHHSAGRLPEAQGIYQQILQAEPKQPVALHLLGVIAHQAGKNDTAVDSIGKALAINSDYAEAHNNLGLALNGLGRLDEAVANAWSVIKPEPTFLRLFHRHFQHLTVP